MTHYLRRLIHKVFRIGRERILVASLAIPQNPWGKRARRRATVPVVVCMTSHPGRIRHAWIAVETLLRQDVTPTKLILFLNDEEFPTRELPGSIVRQTRRGLVVHWLTTDGRSYDKLLPARRLFPDCNIITVDDDKYFPANLVRLLTESAKNNPQAVVGARGWKINATTPGSFTYGAGWQRVTQPERGHDLFMPGGNGCLYPPSSLDTRVDDLKVAETICPTADDIWFWAALSAAGTESICLGLNAHQSVSPQSKSEALSHINVTANDRQWKAAIEHFELHGFIASFLTAHEPSVDREPK